MCCAYPAESVSKITVSHSTIEKQRRDRINSLIDEVRFWSAAGWLAHLAVQAVQRSSVV